MATKVRSRLLHEAAGINEKFGEHLAIIWRYDQTQKKKVLEYFPSLLHVTTERELWVAREKAVRALGGIESDAIKAIEVLLFLSSNWDPVRDKCKIALQDFKELGVLPEDPRAKKAALGFMGQFFAVLESDSQRRLEVSTTRGMLPSLVNLDIAIDRRAVIKSEFDWRNDDPSKYRPVINKHVSVAVLRLRLDEGKPLVFQCSREDLGMLVRRIQASLKDMAASDRSSKV